MKIALFHKPLGSLSDDELMQKAAIEDDDKAFGVLYQRHARRLMGFFFRQIGRDEVLAADFMQDAFLRLWMSRSKFAGSGFRVWLFTIAFNLLKNHYRNEEYKNRYELDLKQREEATDSRIAEEIDEKAFDLALQKELDKLSPEHRLLFSLRFEEAMTVPAIAEVMSLPEGTVKSRLHKLTLSLKQKLNPHDAI